jgi:hypothetical protein
VAKYICPTCHGASLLKSVDSDDPLYSYCSACLVNQYHEVCSDLETLQTIIESLHERIVDLDLAHPKAKEIHDIMRCFEDAHL